MEGKSKLLKYRVHSITKYMEYHSISSQGNERWYSIDQIQGHFMKLLHTTFVCYTYYTTYHTHVFHACSHAPYSSYEHAISAARLLLNEQLPLIDM